MPINTITYAQILMQALDEAAVRDAVTGWMDANAGQVRYRRYHDLWVMDNKKGSIYVSVKDAQQ